MPRRAPAGLGAAGKALWRAILADVDPGWELDRRELELLRRACRCADELESLEAAVDAAGPTVKGSRGQLVVHPALSEARQLRLAQLRLLSAIELTDPAAAEASSPAHLQARRAANQRWARQRRIESRRAELRAHG